MRVEEVLSIKGTDKQEFTKLARIPESIRNGVVVDDGSNLKEEWSDEDKKIAEEHILLELIPVINEISKEKSRKYMFNYDREENYHQTLMIMVFEEFPKYNKLDPENGKTKTFDIEAFVEVMAKASFRRLMMEERGLSKKTVIKMSQVNNAMVEIFLEEECSYGDDIREKLYERLKDSGMSGQMIDTLYLLLRGTVSIDSIPDFEDLMESEGSDVESNAKFDIDAHTKAKLDAVFVTFSDAELFILMKEFDLLGDNIGSMTVKEVSYQDYFIKLVRQEKLGVKNIEFGNVLVQNPGRNTRAEELLVENVYYVKERYYNNKVAKIKRKLSSLADILEEGDLKGCLEEYCVNIWFARELDKVLCK